MNDKGDDPFEKGSYKETESESKYDDVFTVEESLLGRLVGYIERSVRGWRITLSKEGHREEWYTEPTDQ